MTSSKRRVIFAVLALSALSCAGYRLERLHWHYAQGQGRSGRVRRTLEWGSFDLKLRLVIVPRGFKFSASMPDGTPGMVWRGKYGVVGIDAVEKDIVVDGMNEKGLAVGLFYHPGFAEYQLFDPALSATTMGPTDLGQYLLSTCATVDEIRAAIKQVRVVAVIEPCSASPRRFTSLQRSPVEKPLSLSISRVSSSSSTAPLGVITNAPSYDWHETNLRNYVNLSPVALPGRKIDELDFRPLGGGSGMIGLPGDFTPPSRFVRAVAFSKTARPTQTGDETVYELFRILDNFNVPLGAAEGTGEEKTHGMRSSTIWTTAYDTKNLVMYYHTQHNRRVRKVDLARVDFEKPREIVRFPLDKEKKQDIEDVTPGR